MTPWPDKDGWYALLWLLKEENWPWFHKHGFVSIGKRLEGRIERQYKKKRSKRAKNKQN